MTSLEGVKVGDLLHIHEQYGNAGRIVKVDRITATQVVCGAQRFRLRDGWLVGGDSWSGRFARRATPELIEDVRRQRLIHEIESVKRGELRALSTTDLQSVLVILRRNGTDK